jgi:hypothetical protein
MSRGLGKVQRAIIEVLQAHDGSCGLHQLVREVYYPFDASIHRDLAHYRLLYADIQTRDRPAYVATWRAVQTLQRRGIARSVAVNVRRELADLLPRSERQWIKVELAEELRLPKTTLVVRNDQWSDPRRLTIARDWRAWAEREGYRPIQDEHMDTVQVGLEVWARRTWSEPYLVYAPALPGQTAPSLDICPSRERAQEAIAILQRLFVKWQSPPQDAPTQDVVLP